MEEALRRVGKRVVLALPLGIGKPNLIANEFFRRARGDATLDLTIFTALSLRKPTGSSPLEKAFHRSAGGARVRQLSGSRLPGGRAAQRRAAERARHRILLRAGLAAQLRTRAVALPVRELHARGARAAGARRRTSSRTWSPSASWAATPRSVSAAIRMSRSTCCRRSRSCAPRARRWCMLGQVHREMPFMLGAANVRRGRLRPAARPFALRLRPVRAAESVAVDGGSRDRPAREQPGARRRHAADRHRRTRRLHRLFAAAAPPAERSLAARARRRRHRTQRGADRFRRRPRAVRHRPVRRHRDVRRPDARPVPRRHPAPPRLRLSTAAARAGRERLEHAHR